MESSAEATIKVAKERKRAKHTGKVRILANGLRVKFREVPPAVIQTIQARIKPPPVPMAWIEQKGREEPNPSDPGYVAALQQMAIEKNEAVLDAMIMFGVEIDPTQAFSRQWLKKLQMLGIEFNADDPDEVEFWLKKTSLGTADILALMEYSGIRVGEVEELKELFRRHEKR